MLVARGGLSGRLPLRNGGLIKPERQVATPLQASLVDRPVPDPTASLRNVVAAAGIMLEGHVQERDGLAFAGLPCLAPRTDAHYPQNL